MAEGINSLTTSIPTTSVVSALLRIAVALEKLVEQKKPVYNPYVPNIPSPYAPVPHWPQWYSSEQPPVRVTFDNHSRPYEHAGPHTVYGGQ